MPTAITFPGRSDPIATMERMVKIVMAEYDMPAVIDQATKIAATAQEKNAGAIAYALLTWLRVNTRFVNAPFNQQLLKSPGEMLAVIERDGVAGGDCVSVAMLAASLALAVSLPAAFLAEGYGPTVEPARTIPLTHVYTIVGTQAGWLNLDTQRPGDAPPVEPVARVRVTIP